MQRFLFFKSLCVPRIRLGDRLCGARVGDGQRLHDVPSEGGTKRMAKKKLALMVGRGVVVAGVGLSLLRSDDAVAMDDLGVVQKEVRLALEAGYADVARALAKKIPDLRKEVVAHQRAVRRAARREKVARGIARAKAMAPVVKKQPAKGRPKAWKVVHVPGEGTSFQPVRV